MIFGVLVVVHEAGHFAMAKRVGVRVLRFSVGYPPKVWGFRRGETEYSIGATPFGGYVRMLGDEVGEEPTPDEARRLSSRNRASTCSSAARDGMARLARHRAGARCCRRPSRIGSRPDAERGRECAGGAQADHRPRIEARRSLLLPSRNARGSVDEADQSAGRDIRPPALLERYRSRALPDSALGKRFAIVLAGPLSNIIFAPMLLTFVFMYGVP